MTSSERSPCVSRPGERCGSYYPGHNTHWIHAGHVSRTPWGWRDAVVSGIDGCRLAVIYVDGGREVQLWHHEELADELAVGAPVRLHEQYHVFGGPFGWLNVVVRGGLRPVPAPADASAWEREMTGGVQDMRTGRALALDWRQDGDR